MTKREIILGTFGAAVAVGAALAAMFHEPPSDVRKQGPIGHWCVIGSDCPICKAERAEADRTDPLPPPH